jgi:hypothetical protein
LFFNEFLSTKTESGRINLSLNISLSLRIKTSQNELNQSRFRANYTISIKVTKIEAQEKIISSSQLIHLPKHDPERSKNTSQLPKHFLSNIKNIGPECILLNLGALFLFAKFS